jgi:hypothetical protein
VAEINEEMRAADRAVELIRSHWHVGMAVILTREHDPLAVSEYGETATIDGVCRRIVAALLNEGWTPPPTPAPTTPTETGDTK